MEATAPVSLISQLALTYFLVSNPIGNTPTILALLKNFDIKRQKHIMLREGVFALIIALVFQFCGEFILKSLHVDPYTLSLCGGILLFILALQMIFANEKSGSPSQQAMEPFIVPIATPLISGPGLLSIIMLTAATEPSSLKITFAILLAWVGVLIVFSIGPYLKKILGTRGLGALQQIMGMILALIATEMVLGGAAAFVTVLKAASNS